MVLQRIKGIARGVIDLNKLLFNYIQTLAEQAGVFCFTSKKKRNEIDEKNIGTVHSADRPGKK